MTVLASIDDLARFLFGAAGLAAVASGLLYVTRSAITKAIDHAGAREIERLKGELATQVEKVKSELAGELEKKRQAFARELEAFKAELTFDAEVRRQVAARKVEALLKIAESTNTLIRVVLSTRDNVRSAERFEALIKWAHDWVDRDALLPPECEATLHTFAGEVNAANVEMKLSEMGQPADVARAHARLQEARRPVLEMLRRELQVARAERSP